MTHVVLDTGALLALERRNSRMVALVGELTRSRRTAHVPAGVVAQAWRGSPRQHAMARLLKAEAVRVDALTEATALRVGLLLAITGTSDVVDAHVALLARQYHATVVTSDPTGLKHLDGSLTLVTV